MKIRDYSVRGDAGENFFRRLIKKQGIGQVLTVSVGLIVMCIAFGAINPNFFSGRNIANLLREVAPILIIGIGQSYVLITGNIDLSIGSVIGMSTMLSASLMVKGLPIPLVLLLTVGACLIIGLINGVLVSVAGLPPFIATLGTMTVARGLAQIPNYNTNGIGEYAAGFRQFFYLGKTLGLYNTVWIAIVIFLVFNFILSNTASGRHIYAIGSNISAAKLSGVSVFSTTTKVYLVSSFCACIVGLITTATSGMGAMDAGNGYEMFAVAASVIGGVSTLGGQGILIGTVIGSGIWAVLQNGLRFANAPLAIRNIVIGVIVVLSVLIDVVLRKNRRIKAPKSDV